MRRFLSLFTMLMLCGVLAFAQSRVVTGKVTDPNGNPVSFATVKVKGTNTGLSADANGAYSIRVTSTDVLVISAAGFKDMEVPVGTQSVLFVVMETGGVEMKEVVVTSAFGTKRIGRSVSSNVQNVGSEQLNTIRQQNVNNALAGKVAGAQVRSQSAGKLGVETAIRLRGENGLLNNGSGAIYVVDGTITPSANDINPDDIEDLTVLQGPSAAALFGPDGANGAIVITTKKARKGAPGLGIEINSGIQYDEIYILPQYQNSYAGGNSADLKLFTYNASMPAAWKVLDGKYYPNYSDDASWGPKMVGQEYIPWYAWYSGHERSFKTASLTPQPTNIRDFYNTGITKTNNVSFSKATDNINVRVSYTNLDQKGLTPTEWLKRHTLNFKATIDLSSKFVIGANVNYMAQDRNAENSDAYASNSTGNFNQWFHRDLDMGILRELKGLTTPDGILASWNHLDPTSYNPASPAAFYQANYWYNPHAYFDNIQNLNRRDRLMGDISLTYKMNNDFNVKFTYRKNQLTTTSDDIVRTIVETSANQTGARASYSTGNSFSDRQNYEGLMSYTKKIKKFSINANAGFDIFKTTLRSITSSTVNGLVVPDLYSLSNSKDNINYNETRQKFQRRSLFIRADIGFNNYLFAEGTYRRDYTSTEPKGNYIDSKSGGLSFVFSDLIRNTVPFISYGKIRGSIGQSLNTLGIYDLNIAYSPLLNQWAGNILMNEPNVLVDPNLQGSTNNEKEIGLEMRFLKNRFGFNFTYWDRTNKNFPVSVSTTGTTGYTSVRRNAGEVAKTGIDVSVFVKPVVSKNFDWNINATWGRLIKNEVVSIFPGITRLVVSSGAFSTSSAAYTVNEVGKPWGQMFGGGIKRNASGVPILTADGLFTREADVNFGSVLPDYTGGVQNSMTLFKNFEINVNIDYSYGGKFSSLSDMWGTFSGLTARTAQLNDRGFSVRDPAADGGGVHVIGVDANNKVIDTYVEGQTYYQQFRNANIAEASVYDLSFVKLRELSIGYKFPIERMGLKKYITNATFSVVSRNPWLIWSKTKDFDPSEISGTYGEDAQFPGTRSIGVNLKVGF